MDGLVLGASSGIAQALLQEAWRRPARPGERWLLSTRAGQPLPVLETAAKDRLLTWRALDALDDPSAFLAGLDGWRPGRVLVAWGRLVPGGRGSVEEIRLMREINGPATLRWLAALADWLPADGSCRVAVLGSVAGDRPRRGQWEYCLSKQELERGLDELRRRAPAIRWTLVKPGPVATPMTAHLRPGPLLAAPQAIAPRLLRAWEEGRPQVYAPAFWGLVSRALAGVPERLWRRLPF
jgi:NADP-dependent 3-hydroxy acid dehydrogenase YdfG